MTSGLAAAVTPPAHNLMPAPAELQWSEGRLPITPNFRVALRGHADARLAAAVGRVSRRWEERTGYTFPREETLDPQNAVLIIECERAAPDWPELGENEAYTLDVEPTQATLRAETVTGVLRGLETWAQLLQSDAQGWFVPVVEIDDHPRFPWRGLLLDVARHWQPLEVVKRQLDAMSVVKLNVLHLHLTEDQGFRIESRTHPRLHQLGSDGLYFTHQDIREILAYAAARGIRVVPEFDLPGHATSWLVAYPELGSQPGPYSLIRTWGIFDPALDPTNESVYELLDDFLGEMASLFPDPYIHIGGDEVNGKHWAANERIQQFIQEQGLNGAQGLQTYFNQRVQAILAKYGKRMVGWDEILQPGLPTDAVIQSWRGPDSLAEAARQGYSGILSNGYYIDLIYPAADHYLNDPLPAGTPLRPEQQARVLGGEATMWSEWVTPETIDSRIWPRTAAIAERLWSPRDVNDVADMYRRLDVISRRLEEVGTLHERNIDPMIRRFAGDHASAADRQALRAVINVLEPVKQYRRGQQQPDATQFTPLTGITDIARPDSAAARTFAQDVHRLLAPEIGSGAAERLRSQLIVWARSAQELELGLAQRAPRVQEQIPLLQSLQEGCRIAMIALESLTEGKVPADGWLQENLQALEKIGRAHGAVEIVVVPSFRRLVVAAAIQPSRAFLAPEEWLRRVDAIAAPPAEATPGH